jgi:hypothetical protein
VEEIGSSDVEQMSGAEGGNRTMRLEVPFEIGIAA